MKSVFHAADSRGEGEHGWLSTRFSFSFANWHDPERMGFGALRVLNDDAIAPESGFGAHAHKDFEIITIVREGAVTHEDSLGNTGRVVEGEVQVMSAGTGVVHAELNKDNDPLKLFQIWIAPNETGVAPRYGQKAFELPPNALTLLVSGDGRDGSLMIHQDAALYEGRLIAEETLTHALVSGNGAYLFVIEGSVTVGDQTLTARDALGITDTDTFTIEATEDAELLLIEVPMG